MNILGSSRKEVTAALHLVPKYLLEGTLNSPSKYPPRRLVTKRSRLERKPALALSKPEKALPLGAHRIDSLHGYCTEENRLSVNAATRHLIGIQVAKYGYVSGER